MTEPDQTQQQIMKAIADCKNDDLRAVLVLFHGGFQALGEKIDNVLKNEDAIKQIALNGHTDTHSQDHDWIKVYRRHSDRFVRDHEQLSRLDFAKLEKISAWAEDQMQYQQAIANSRRRVGEGVAINILTSLVSILGTILAIGAYIYFN